MTVFFSQLINGLSLGSIYALIALGYSMVYGIILLLNFAHGDVIMVGAYMSWFVMNQLGLGPVTAVCATIITCTLLGVVIEKIAYTPLRNAPRISLLITAIGVSFFLEYTAELIMGSGAKVIPAYYTNQTFRLGKVPLGLTSIITLAVTVLSMLVLTFLVQKTKLGKAMRAVSEDMDAARLMGINVNSTISFTFAVGSALAGIGSVLYCCSYPQATPTMGSMLGLKAFVAAVLGGIGSIPGAMVGGIVIGLCECFVSAIGLSAWKDAVTFAILIIVLLFKDNWAEITAALSQLSAWQVLVVLAIGLSYPLLEGCVSYVIVRGRLPGFTLRQGIDNAWCGTFGNVVTLGAGAVPVQTWYLHQAGLPIGPGVGLMTLQYVFHKTTVLLYATVMLLLQHKWLAANTTGVLKYLPMAYAVVALVIVALVLVCVSPLVQNLARWALGFLPKTEKWQQRRADWLEQLDVLGTESRLLLADKARCVQIFALQALKLFLLFCLPWLCIRFMQLSPLSFARVQLLTSLMLFVSNALPNVAGMGSIETAFLLLYSSFLPSGEVMSVLMLYRIASYYFVFAASAVGFFLAQRRLTRTPPKEA